jgi:hypothetical protein
MGNSEPSDEEIRNWIKTGWKFREKKSKGRKYITRRMGAKTERSLGPFNQELWNRIENIKRESDKPPKETDPMDLFYTLIEFNRSARAGQDCLNKDEEGYCTYWRWESDYGFLNYRGDLEMKEVKDGKKIAYLFRANRKYCQGCNAYISPEIKKVLMS